MAHFKRRALLIEITNNLFFTGEGKANISVGFSRKSFTSHTGINGLKYYLVVMFLRKHLDAIGEVSMTFTKLLTECGYSTTSHNKDAYSSFRLILHNLIDDGFISYATQDVLKVSPSTHFTIQLPSEKTLFFTKDNFVLFNVLEFDRIAEIRSSVNKSVLVGVYLYIKQFIHTDSKIAVQPKVSYPPKKAIQNALGISSIRTVESAIALLVKARLLYVGADFYTENLYQPGYYSPARNIYGLCPLDVSDKVCMAVLGLIYSQPIYKKHQIPQDKILYLTKNK